MVPRNGGTIITIPAGNYTELHCGDDLVMHDTPAELATHLEFAMKARGNVLISGLGLGCVMRMCLMNPAVERITVVERSEAVMRLVAPYVNSPTVSIIQSDAVEYADGNRMRFDCAWHDLWSDPESEDEHLQLIHARLIAALAPMVGMQGAWEFPRPQRRLWGEVGVI